MHMPPLFGKGTSSVAINGADTGQVQVSTQLLLARSPDFRNLDAGISKHELFFVHRPRASMHTPRVLETVMSLSNLNKLLFNDAIMWRSGRESRYHAMEPALPDTMTCDSIVREWNFFGVCTATEGTSVVERAYSDKLSISAVVGGWVKALNYWGVRSGCTSLWLVIKLVKVNTDRGSPKSGSFMDMSHAAVRQRALRRTAAGAAALSTVDRDDFKRRRMLNGDDVDGTVENAWLAWQVCAHYDESGEGPAPDEYTGSIVIGTGPAQKRIDWYGHVLRVGRTGFVSHQGAKPIVSIAQYSAAEVFTHPFEIGGGGASIDAQAAPMAEVGDVDVFIGM